jgi:hypothetical protein
MRLSDVIRMFLFWAGLAALAILGHYFLSDRVTKILDRVLRHPAFLISLWAIIVWVLCRRWSRRPHISIGLPLVRPSARV